MTLAPAHAQLHAAAAGVVRMAHACAQRGWAPATSGNFSARVDESTLAISVSGIDKGELSQSDVVLLAVHGPVPPRASAEAPLHRALYRRLPAIGAVAHVHSLSATLASIAHERNGCIVIEGLELLKAFAGVGSHATAISIPVLPNTQDMEGLGAAIETGKVALGEAPVLLLAGHGAYVWGRDASEVLRHLDALDFLLTVMLHREGHAR